MQAAILEGLYNGTGQPLISCPTGNCTWTDLTTLGVCGMCEDITSQVETKCPGRTIENNGQYECDYAMPLNVSLKGYIYTLGGSGISSQTTWNSSGADYAILKADPTPKTPAILQMFEAIQLPLPGLLGDDIPPPKASRCSFALCAKTYAQVNVTNGIPRSSVPTEDLLLLDNVSNRSSCPTCDVEIFQNMVRNSSTSDGSDQAKFSINVADYQNIQSYLQEMFSTGWDSIGGSTRATSNDSAMTPTAPDVGRELASASDLNATIRAIAESMTESIRTSPNSTSQPGQSYNEKTFIEVQWGWLAFPIALMLLTLILLVAVIVETQRRGAVTWKSSGLALLFHELDGWNLPGSHTTNSQLLDRTAGKMRGRLSDGRDRLAFVKED